MLVVPVFTRSNSTNVPWICILLIVINTLILFTLQAGDSSIYNRAYQYYEQSRLVDIEVQAYGDFLQKKGTPEEIAFPETEEGKERLARQMLQDDQFAILLEQDQIITLESPNYQQWRDKRNRFEEILGSAAIIKYGYSPRKNNVTGLFSCIFLHGGFMHLLGNMVFLYLVGAILEVALGPSLFLGLYLITGVCASVLFGIVYPTASGPLVGASGAISGLMGSYGVIFGMRKIRVFYSLGFYFNYAMVPALALFPFWLLKEFFQLSLNTESNVAYVAHIGGLLSGLLIGTAYKLLRAEQIEALFTPQTTQNALDKYLDEGLDYLEKLDLPKARAAFAKALELAPDNLMVLRQLYSVDKSRPNSEQFHESARCILRALIPKPPEDFLEILEDYTQTASQPRLQLVTIEHASHLYLKVREYRKAAPLISTLFRKNPDRPGLPHYLLTLAEGLLHDNRSTEASQCLKALIHKYPGSDEALQARTRLRSPGFGEQPN
ncbi:rhomboid family intramembrane serine protease [Desulfosediminicola sp.]|uniref:rhomboid family intramembrane serine protease n=1 Tax=Desulfosediminicola sp. TaxID=2886825 RepID=UPI003AF1FCAA